MKSLHSGVIWLQEPALPSSQCARHTRSIRLDQKLIPVYQHTRIYVFRTVRLVKHNISVSLPLT
jgi:hypothetical protein